MLTFCQNGDNCSRFSIFVIKKAIRKICSSRFSIKCINFIFEAHLDSSLQKNGIQQRISILERKKERRKMMLQLIFADMNQINFHLNLGGIERKGTNDNINRAIQIFDQDHKDLKIRLVDLIESIRILNHSQSVSGSNKEELFVIYDQMGLLASEIQNQQLKTEKMGKMMRVSEIRSQRTPPPPPPPTPTSIHTRTIRTNSTPITPTSISSTFNVSASMLSAKYQNAKEKSMSVSGFKRTSSNSSSKKKPKIQKVTRQGSGGYCQKCSKS